MEMVHRQCSGSVSAASLTSTPPSSGHLPWFPFGDPCFLHFPGPCLGWGCITVNSEVEYIIQAKVGVQRIPLPTAMEACQEDKWNETQGFFPQGFYSGGLLFPAGVETERK